MRSIASLLSHQIVVGMFIENPNSLRSDLIHKASCVALVRAIYSASVDERATMGCSLDCQVIGEFPKKKTFPEVDLLVIKSPAQSASE